MFSIRLLAKIWRQVSNAYSQPATKVKPGEDLYAGPREGANQERGGCGIQRSDLSPRPVWPALHPGKRYRTEERLHFHQSALCSALGAGGPRGAGALRRALNGPRKRRAANKQRTYPVSSTWRGDKRGSLCGWQHKPSPARTR